MTLTHHTTLRGTQYAIITAEATAAEVDEGLGEALALTEGYNELGDFVYSGNAESNDFPNNSTPGEPTAAQITAGLGEVYDLDAEPGVLYSGPSGVGYRISLSNCDITEGAGNAEDGCNVGLVVNSRVVAWSDEGWSDVGEATVEFNADTYVTLQEGDAIRVGLFTKEGEADGADYDVAVTGTLVIV